MNGSIARFRSSSRRREKTMTIARPSKPVIPPAISMDWNLHVKDYSSQIKERSLYQKETHVCRYKKTLYGEYLIYTAEAW
jgi:hypothetical protein